MGNRSRSSRLNWHKPLSEDVLWTAASSPHHPHPRPQPAPRTTPYRPTTYHPRAHSPLASSQTTSTQPQPQGSRAASTTMTPHLPKPDELRSGTAPQLGLQPTSRHPQTTLTPPLYRSAYIPTFAPSLVPTSPSPVPISQCPPLHLLVRPHPLPSMIFPPKTPSAQGALHARHHRHEATATLQPPMQHNRPRVQDSSSTSPPLPLQPTGPRTPHISPPRSSLPLLHHSTLTIQARCLKLRSKPTFPAQVSLLRLTHPRPDSSTWRTSATSLRARHRLPSVLGPRQRRRRPVGLAVLSRRDGWTLIHFYRPVQVRVARRAWEWN